MYIIHPNMPNTLIVTTTVTVIASSTTALALAVSSKPLLVRQHQAHARHPRQPGIHRDECTYVRRLAYLQAVRTANGIDLLPVRPGLLIASRSSFATMGLMSGER